MIIEINIPRFIKRIQWALSITKQAWKGFDPLRPPRLVFTPVRITKEEAQTIFASIWDSCYEEALRLRAESKARYDEGIKLRTAAQGTH